MRTFISAIAMFPYTLVLAFLGMISPVDITPAQAVEITANDTDLEVYDTRMVTFTEDEGAVIKAKPGTVVTFTVKDTQHFNPPHVVVIMDTKHATVRMMANTLFASAH